MPVQYTLEEVQELVDQALESALKCFNEERYGETDMILKRILEHFDSENLQALQLYGLTMYQKEQYEDAIPYFEKAIELQPKNGDNYTNLGMCHGKLGDDMKAVLYLGKAIGCDRKNSLYWNNLAHQHRRQKDFDKALQYFQEASTRDRNNVKYIHNIGGTYLEKKEPRWAIKYLENAVEYSEDSFGPHVDLAYAYQLDRRWTEAWEFYEHRMEYFKQAAYFREQYDQEKRWTSSDVYGTLVVYCEQGVGDLIQSLRFVSKVPADVVVECPESMVSLLEANGFNTTTDGSKVEYDFHCSIMSLPHLLKLEDFEKEAACVPYLVPGKEADLDHYEGLRVGICWAGNPQHPRDNERSCYLKEFQRIADVTGVKLFNLQKDARSRVWPPAKEPIDLTEGAEFKVIDVSPHLQTYQDTAAIIQEMDVVITVDTAILHLASALGKPTWGLIAETPDTRWGLSGESTFWYPTLRLFRQKNRNVWKDVIKRCTREVTHLLEGNRE